MSFNYIKRIIANAAKDVGSAKKTVGKYAEKYGSKANIAAKRAFDKNVYKPDVKNIKAAQSHADFMRTRARLDPSEKNLARLSQAEQNVANVPPIERSWREISQEHPWKTAAALGGAGVLGYNMIPDSYDSGDYPPELQEVIVQLRAKGASDEEIQQYLDQLMEVGE